MMDQTSSKAEGLYLLGDQQFEKQDFSAAIESYSAALALQPNHLMAIRKRGLSKYYLRDLPGAIEDYTSALQLDAEDPTGYFNRGICFTNQRNFTAALEDYEKALWYGYNEMDVFKNRAYTRYLAEDYEGAAKDYTYLLQHDPADKVALYLRGVCYYYLDRSKEAAADLSEAARLGHNDITLYYYLGYSQSVEQQNADALASLDIYLAEVKTYAYAWLSRGYVYFSLQRYEEAIADYDETIKLDPSINSAYYYRGLAKEKKGDTAGAKADAEKALELGYAEAAALLESLNKQQV